MNERRGGVGGASPPYPAAARAAPARHLLIFAPHPPGAPHTQALAPVGQGCF